jgi:hypothetical protein
MGTSDSEPAACESEAVNPATKPWWQSKTLWLNFVSILVLLVTAITQADKANPQVVTIGGAIVGFLNILLRLGTGSKLT